VRVATTLKEVLILAFVPGGFAEANAHLKQHFGLVGLSTLQMIQRWKGPMLFLFIE
jgi:hypothetical protein